MKVFYSWQSDLDKKTNNYFIKEQIRNAIRKINKNVLYDEREENLVELDHDTKGISGSPQIDSTIFDKINSSDVFIGDVSIINSEYKKLRKTPNPNVLIELGFAAKTLGWGNIILIANLHYSDLEKLPFDIKGRRITTYDLAPNSDKGFQKKQKEKLSQILVDAITMILPENRIKKQKDKIPIDGKIIFEKIYHQSNSGIWKIKAKILLINNTNENIEAPVIQLAINDKPSKDYRSIDKILYSGKPIQIDEIFSFDYISKPIKFKISFASKLISYRYSEYEIQISEEDKVKYFKGGGAGFQRNYELNVVETKENEPIKY